MANFRSKFDGQLGTLIIEGGKEYILLDRPQERILKPYREADWIPEAEDRPLTKSQVARIAFEADRALCMAIGKHEQSRKSWENVSRDDKQRTEWVHGGPPKADKERRALYEHVIALYPNALA